MRGQTLEKRTWGKDGHTVGKMGRGPAKTAPPHPTLHFTRSPLGPQVVAPPRAGHYNTALKVSDPGRPRWEGRTGEWRGGSLSPSDSRGEVCGCRGASGPEPRVLLRGFPALALVSRGRLAPPHPPFRWDSAAAGRTRRHMMAQRLRRSAPWKRRAACTCLQRAQPTLLSSSLKSSRMCQLYLAEHST